MAEDLKKCIKKCTLNDTKKTKEESTTLLSIVPTRVVKKIQIGKNETVAILILLIPESE